ncbi:MAG: 1-deoxy-D-xylulose-5-phosphate reductoisomerase [Candidatus Omnitrophota bacterium]
MKSKKIIILGSTGSIGQTTLNVVRQDRKRFRIIGLTAGSNTELLKRQIEEFRPKAVAIFDEKKLFSAPSHTRIFRGLSGINELVKSQDADLVVIATSGANTLFPLISSIRSKKDIALANKETIVMAGDIINDELTKSGVNLIPIDSEQSAIFQCIRNEDNNDLNKIYLTASGGPFYNYSKDKLENITPDQALRHPCWNMGKKITIDSATMMNKGLEVIEAMYLFKMHPKNINILIHPEVIIHSMVEFVDGIVMAQLSQPHMKFPIFYALNFPSRTKNRFKKVDFIKIKNLNFLKPDFNKFPCLKLAYKAAFSRGTVCTVLNAANEELVKAFLARKIKFMDIPKLLEKVLSRHRQITKPNIIEILSMDTWARDEAVRYINKQNTLRL